MRKSSTGVAAATSRATYEAGAETFLERQLREFHHPETIDRYAHLRDKHGEIVGVGRADWAPFDPLNGKAAAGR